MSKVLGKPRKEHAENWTHMFSAERLGPEENNNVKEENKTIYNNENHKTDDNEPQNITNTSESPTQVLLHHDVNKQNPYRKLKEIIPYEERLETRRREEIFKDFTPELSIKVIKARHGYSRRKKERREIASACLNVDYDIRPYMDIQLNGIEIKGLMDSGASVSCLGKNCMENLHKMNANILDYKSSIKTADGRNHLIIGKTRLTVQCGSKTKEMLFYLVPNLQQ